MQRRASVILPLLVLGAAAARVACPPAGGVEHPARLFFDAGLEALDAGRPEEALARLRRARARGYEGIELLRALAGAHDAVGDQHARRAALEEARASGDRDPATAWALVEARERLGVFADALALARTLVGPAEPDAARLLMLGRLAEAAGLAARAQADEQWRAARALAPAAPEPAAAQTARAQGDALLAEAEAHYHAARQRADTREVEYRLARLSRLTGRRDQARQLLQLLAEEAPEYFDAQLDYGALLVEDALAVRAAGEAARAAGLVEQAATALDRAYRRRPDHPGALANLAVCRRLQGDTARARRMFETLVERHPGAPAGPYYLGLLAAEEGAIDEARRQWGVLLRQGPLTGERADYADRLASALDAAQRKAGK